MFSCYLKLGGRQWLRFLSGDDRRAFSGLGFSAVIRKHGDGFWRSGGRARASSARRDSRGRFLPASGS